ncbi:hypothetical protein ACFFGT_23815 [Mucilaginibacter angelicae]|uniref:Carboxypeptidase regulatory-like domain-containing protein n=1 Tax=Mucilaginibacter angelicae TaxID=869718 RepID=A0ABV6LCQ7_9SPHI
MRKIFLCLVPVLVSTVTLAQTITVSGTVNNQQGKPVQFVFIRDAYHSYATYTDQMGNFSLKADPASKLVASATNLKDTTIVIGNQSNIKITMTAGLSQGAGKALSSHTGSDFFKMESEVPTNISGSLYMISGHDELHGSRFLSKSWMHGFALSVKDSLIQSNDYFFNFDKDGGDLLFTRDQRKVFQADKGEVKACTIIDDNDQAYSFETVPAIDPNRFILLLVKGDKYKIYNKLKSKFVKASFTTNGITSSGNNYDEYVDENHYFVLNVKTNQLQPLELKSKSIKTVFATEADKIKAFNKEHGDDEINEGYLRDLGDYLNK